VVFLLVVASSLLGIWMLRNQKLGALITLSSVLRQGQQVSLYSLLWPLRYALSGPAVCHSGHSERSAGHPAAAAIQGTKPEQCHQPDSMADDVIEGEFSRVDPKRNDPRRIH
jgi:UPF0716 protein FxsA